MTPRCEGATTDDGADADAPASAPRFPPGCPVLYDVRAVDGALTHARAGTVARAPSAPGREYRIAPLGGGAAGGGKEELVRAREAGMAYGLGCPVWVVAGAAAVEEAEEAEAGEAGEAGKVLAFRPGEDGGGMRYTVRYAAAKEGYALRMEDGVAAHRLSYAPSRAAAMERNGRDAPRAPPDGAARRATPDDARALAAAEGGRRDEGDERQPHRRKRKETDGSKGWQRQDMENFSFSSVSRILSGKNLGEKKLF